MKILFARGILALACVAVSSFALGQKKSASEYTVEEFFRRAQFTDMQLAPDGERLAARAPFKGRNNLVIIDLTKRTRKVITDFERVDVAQIFWVNNERICMRVADGQDVTGRFNYRGTFCIDHDGENLRDFTKIGVRDPTVTAQGYKTIIPLAHTRDGSPEMIVEMAERSRDSRDVFRFNTRTGRYQLLTEDNPGYVTRWVLDRNLVPRVAVSIPKRKNSEATRVRTVWYRDGDRGKWEKIHETEILGEDESSNSFIPLGFDFDNRTLYVSSNEGRDRNAVYKYDTSAKKLGELMFEHPLIDLDGGLIFSWTQKKLLGIRYNADVPGVAWVDEGMARMQKSVDAAFPRNFNTIGLPSETDKRALIFSFSDVDPGAYYLMERGEKPKVEFLAKTREWLDPALMAQRRFIKYKARDGMEIPAWVTMPKGGGKNLPLIVNIHGGPWVRVYGGTQWGRPDAQFFASRGYVVLEPEPRGSTGFGWNHYRAAFKQWGQSMQDDITDGALHLVNEGIVDKRRMCLHGGSYGGYATAMGLAKDPDLWKCGSPYVAVTDLAMMQSVTYSDISMFSDFLQTDFKKLVGDSSADREMFTKYSPLQQADKIKAAVFLSMGSDDMRVPQVHGDRFHSALEAAGKKVQYVVYPGEGHGYNKDEHVFDFYRRLERFHAEHLK